MTFRFLPLFALVCFAPPAWAQPDPPEPLEEPEPPEAEEPVEPSPEEPGPVETGENEPATAPAPPPDLGEPPPAESAPPPITAAPYEGDPLYAPMQPPPPPPEEPPSSGFKMPPWSARIDPFNWLLEGRLGLELEFGLLDFMTVELVPTFVVQAKPPTLNLSGAPDVLRQESNGLGPISGAALDVGLWLDGTAFHGYVIRLGVATYGYAYRTEDAAGEIDSVDVTERQAFAMFGSQASWGAFTLAGGIGLGVEFNREQRCFPQNATSVAQVQTDGCDDGLQIATDRTAIEPVDLNGSLFPVTLVGRFSLGVLFD